MYSNNLPYFVNGQRPVIRNAANLRANKQTTPLFFKVKETSSTKEASEETTRFLQANREKPTKNPKVPKPTKTPKVPTTPTRAPVKKPSRAPTPAVKYGLQDNCGKNHKSKFNICLDLKSESGSYEPWMEYFALARDRWQDIIVKDRIPAFDLRGVLAATNVATELPPLIDDIYVAGEVTSIDGPLKVLASAGPTYVTTLNGIVFPLSGYMRFDKDDLGRLSNEQWKDLILHELGHVLGFGSALFKFNGLHSGDPTSDLYLGVAANAEWQKLCPQGRIPIETDGGVGYAGGHWDEECLADELMTGAVNGAEYQPISRMTIAAFADLGYTVNMDAADPFTVNDLGDCGTYCPGLRRRELKPSREQREETAKVVSEAGLKTIYAVAAQELKARRDDAPSNLPDGLTYVGGDEITVYIIDTDGVIKRKSVTFEEVQGLIIV